MDSLINIYIPFKDSKGLKRKLFMRELDSIKADIEKRVEELKLEVEVLFGDSLQIAMVGRSDRGAAVTYWRFRSSSQDRKFYRLASVELADYLSILDRYRFLGLKEIEEEIIYLNANMKAIRGMTEAIERCDRHQADLVGL